MDVENLFASSCMEIYVVVNERFGENVFFARRRAAEAYMDKVLADPDYREEWHIETLTEGIKFEADCLAAIPETRWTVDMYGNPLEPCSVL